MDETQYRHLCGVCDEILLSEDANVERIALPWLHVVREHPAFLQKYEYLFYKENLVIRVGSVVCRLVKYILGWFGRGGTNFLNSRALAVDRNDERDHIDVLFVSHLINPNHLESKDDFYYGNCPTELLKFGFSPAIALLNHLSPGKQSRVVERWSGTNIPRFVVPRWLGLGEEIVIWLRLLRESFRLWGQARKQISDLKKRVLVRASVECFAGATFDCLRVEHCIRALVKRYQPRVVIVTYEGHAWERVAFAAARRTKSDIKCVGYHHSVLFRLQHGVRRNLSSLYNPDIILTSGIKTKNELEREESLCVESIAVLGSCQHYSEGAQHKGGASCGIIGGQEKEGRFRCLVIPEGIKDECNILFEFSIECALAMPDVEFIWRLHPVISFDSLKRGNPKLQKLPGNVTLSNREFQYDIALSQMACYRGSSAIVQAALQGLKPFYFRLRGEMTIDPLYGLGRERVIVESVSDLRRQVKLFRSQSDAEVKKDLEKVREYCSKLFEQLSCAELAKVAH